MKVPEKLKKTFFPSLLFLFMVVFLASCAVSTYRQGVRLLKKDEFNEAIELLEEAEQQKSENYKIKRELGVAYYKSNRIDAAINKLKEAKELNPKDSKTVFYLGLSYEANEMLSEAIYEYKNYRSLSRVGGFKKEISKRIKQLTSEQVSTEISRAISQEQSLDVSSIPDNTVAVMYFENLSASDDYDPLQKGLAQMLMTDLAKAQKIQVVERLKLQKLLEELEFGSTGLVDQSSAPRVGKLIGARKLVTGGFTDLTDENFRIDASVAETATTDVSNLEQLTGKLDAIFNLEKQLAFKVIDELGVELTTEEREAIQKIPTESLLAFIAYSKGLDFEDRGMFEQAKQEYETALSHDPDFENAKARLDDVDIVERAATEPKKETSQLEEDYETTVEDFIDAQRMSRLINTSMAAQTGQTVQGDNDTRAAMQEATGIDNPNANRATVPLRIKLPGNN